MVLLGSISWPKARLLQHLPHGLDGDGLEDSAQTTRCHTEAPAGNPGTKYQAFREPAHLSGWGRLRLRVR